MCIFVIWKRLRGHSRHHLASGMCTRFIKFRRKEGRNSHVTEDHIGVCHMKTNMKKKAREHINFRAHTRSAAISTDKRAVSGSSHDHRDCSFAQYVAHRGLGRACNVNVYVLGSDLTWWQHILSSHSWSSRCPSCDQPLLPCWKSGHGVFASFVGRGSWVIVARMDFFAYNGRGWPWCGGDEGIDGIGWRCHRRQGLLSTRTTFRRDWSIVLYDMSKFCGWWHFKILNDPWSTWSQFWNRNGRNKFLVLVVKTLFTTHSTPNCTVIISRKRWWI
jgi:hypothetical protein